MNTNERKRLQCVLQMWNTAKMALCLVVVCMSLSSCGEERNPEKEVRDTFEAFVKTMQAGNHQKAADSYCYGQFKKELTDVIALSALFNEVPSMLHDYKGISKLEFVPNYSDVALVVTELNNKFITYVVHWDESESWKIYYSEEKDLTLIKDFISNDMLSNIGIDTISDSDMNELFDE